MEHIETKNKRYPIVFNLNVMEEIQEQYGSFAKWGEVVDGNGEPQIKDLKSGLLSMINEGIDIENEERQEKEAFITSKQLGRIITEVGLNAIVELIKKTAINSTSTGEEDSKNM